MRIWLASAVIVATAGAQAPTPVNVLPSFGSQVNTTISCLIVSVVNLQAPGFGNVPFVPVIGLFSQSSTLAYTSVGGAPTAPGSLTLNVTVEGLANQPFILAGAALGAGIPCGGAGGTPCLTTPSLFSSLPTPFGLYHLGAQPFFILDGFGSNPFPGVTGPTGRFSFTAPLTIDTAANGGAELRLAAQAVMVDPGSASGFRLSACFNLDQWVSQ